MAIATTWPATLLVMGAGTQAGVNLGERQTFADLGQTLADFFGVDPLANGTSFRAELLDRDREQARTV
jgi:phosphopentomutase